MIDALPLIFEGGISNYVKPLVRSMLKYTGPCLKVELLFRLSFDRMRNKLYKNYLAEDCIEKDNHLITHLPDRLIKELWGRGHCLPFSFSRRTDSVFMATTEMVPQKGNVQVGWIVYDLTPLRIPKFFDSSRTDYLDKMTSLAQRTNFIVTISQNSKKDIVELIHYPEDRIYVIYPGVTEAKSTPTETITRSIKRPYIYYLGSLALNKNVDGMLRIFSKCVNYYGLDLDIVLTGKDFCGRTFWNQIAKEYNIEGRVHSTGWISDQEREQYLSHAVMLWQFSWYEGFGLPVLEAASRGIPVLYSNRGALPEVLNNPEQAIDPDDEKEAAYKAAQTLQSPDALARWKSVGLQRSADFSWDNSAQQLINHLNKLS